MSVWDAALWDSSCLHPHFSPSFPGAQNWKKFGNSEFDPPGPNVATTTVSDDVSMTFITSKEVSRVELEPEKRRGNGVGRTQRPLLSHPSPFPTRT